MSGAGRDDQLSPGTHVGDYRVEAEIGRGAYGAVYAVVHPLIGKRAAAKVLHRDFAEDQSAVKRFIAEARAVNQIGHANIVDIFGFGTLEDGRCFQLMELLEGETLDALLARRGALPPDEAIALLKPIAAALDAAHGQQIAHRDLKPSNIFLSQDGAPKLLDFGIAKLYSAQHAAMSNTATGTVIGTPYYMSPEQIRGTELDHRTDIYSFGVLAYQLLCGRLPFTAASSAELFVQHLHRTPDRPALPEAIACGVLAMLEKDRERRPRTASEALAALTAPVRAMDATLPPVAREPPSAPPAPSRAPMMLAAIAVLVAAIGVMLALQEDDPSAPKPAPAPRWEHKTWKQIQFAPRARPNPDPPPPKAASKKTAGADDLPGF